MMADSTKSMRSVPTALLVTLTLATLVYSLTLTYPFNNDNALYAYMADRALHGSLPYIGTWDQNFPGILLIHIPQILILGYTQIAFHGFDILLQLIGTYLIFSILSEQHSVRAGILGALLAALYYIQQGLWMAGERDTYISILLLGATFLLLRNVTVRNAGWCGLLIGLALFIRPTYGGFFFVFAIWIWMNGANRKWAMFAAYFFAAVTPLGLFSLFYLWLGHFQDFYDATIVFNAKIYSGQGASFHFWEPLKLYALSLPALLVGFVWIYKKLGKAIFLFFVSLAGAGLLSLVVLYRHSVYHYHPMMTFLILISAIGWMELIALAGVRANVNKRRSIDLAGTILILLFFSFQTLRGNTVQQVLRNLFLGRIHSLEDSYAYYEGSSEFGEPVQRTVGDYLIHHTQPGDAVQMFGPYSYPQYRAHLATASRFQTLHALTMRNAEGQLEPFQQKWRRDYLYDLKTIHPKYFIVCDAPEAFRQYYGGRLGHEILRDDFREASAFLGANYTYETKIGAFSLYRSLQ